MDNLNNFNSETNPPAGGLPAGEPVNQPGFTNIPSFQNFPETPKKKSKWSWVVVILVLVFAVYYSGLVDWLGGQFGGSEVTQEEQSEDNLADVKAVTDGDEDEVTTGVVEEVVEPGKGLVTFGVAASLSSGVRLPSGIPQPSLVVREVAVHNSHKDSWVVVYDGFRQINLVELQSTKVGQDLITVSLAALKYDGVRLRLIDMVEVAGSGDQTITRTRDVELMGMVDVMDGAKGKVMIDFNVDDPYKPVPALK